MADFLTRVVERSIGLAQAVEPITVPVFVGGPSLEGGMQPLGLVDEGEPEDAAALGGLRLADSSHLRGEELPNQSNGPQGDTQHLSAPHDKERPTEADSHMSRRDPSLRLFGGGSAPGGQVATLDPHHLSGGLSQPPGPTPRRTIGESTPARIHPETGDMLSDRQVAAQADGTGIPASACDQAPDRIARNAGDLANEDALRLPRSTEGSVRPVISISQRQDKPQENVDAGTGQQATRVRPAVKVTIGRIDVRAVTHEPPPTRPRPSIKPKPRLSLEAYLDQRNKGER